MGMKPVPDEDLYVALEALSSCDGDVAAAARKLNMPRPTLKDRIGMARQRGLYQAPSRADEAARLKVKLRAAEAALAAAQKAEDTAAAIRKEIWGLAEYTPDAPAWLVKEGSSGARGTPCVVWSDWHYGETVRKDEVGGVNEFNAGIAAQRVKRLVSTTIDITRNHMGRAKTVYPGCVIMLGGDMISGDIHEELTATNDRTPQQCVNDLTDLLGSAIETMASDFGKCFIPCVVGNHGRSTRKPRMKGRVFTSHEWNIYCNLERLFRKSKHVQFMIPEDTDAYFRVYGHRYLLTHGDSLGVRGGDGIIGAIGPITRGSIKVGHSEAQIGRDIDTIVMAHWHQLLWLPGAIVNNSLKGYDEFARLALRAPYSRPSQALWFTHPEHGITARWEVFLEGRRNAAEGREWVTFMKEKAA